MAITELERLRLHRYFEGTMGEEQAATLMECLPPAGWGDVATKRDIEQLRVDTHVEFTAVRKDIEQLRVDTHVEFTAVRKDIEYLRADTAKEFELVRKDIANLAEATSKDIAHLADATRKDIANLGEATSKDIANLAEATSKDIAHVHTTLDTRIEAATDKLGRTFQRELKVQTLAMFILVMGLGAAVHLF